MYLFWWREFTLSVLLILKFFHGFLYVFDLDSYCRQINKLGKQMNGDTHLQNRPACHYVYLIFIWYPNELFGMVATMPMDQNCVYCSKINRDNRFGIRWYRNGVGLSRSQNGASVPSGKTSAYFWNDFWGFPVKGEAFLSGQRFVPMTNDNSIFSKRYLFDTIRNFVPTAVTAVHIRI